MTESKLGKGVWPHNQRTRLFPNTGSRDSTSTMLTGCLQVYPMYNRSHWSPRWTTKVTEIVSSCKVHTIVLRINLSAKDFLKIYIQRQSNDLWIGPPEVNSMLSTMLLNSTNVCVKD
ncbi:hypothetical protein K443DRAFT_355383 [Laccaria amethystina LaAM-08-1]|uniref:Uncharacterized protein n=1 Tax=Laccaria amethystina LaAM-08-1 TaxID=1095629 RepID=A0A0C9XA70_9AGAR|nr:hypothetical protein K443DRAFT_355383 [Laccaria amethystina LaAM-08-1]